MKNGKYYEGQYLFTIDFCSPDTGFLDTGWSEVNIEHKSYNVIKLNNGQFCAQPNNRIIWEQQSLIPHEKKKPYFKVCDEDYTSETTPKWDLADTDEFLYRSKIEREISVKDKAGNEGGKTI
jgi:hypothetical protein